MPADDQERSKKHSDKNDNQMDPELGTVSKLGLKLTWISMTRWRIPLIEMEHSFNSNCDVEKMEFSNPDKLLKFNVGGTLFETSVKTITSIKEGLLYEFIMQKIVEGPIILDKEGLFFLDRDLVCFAIILNYLRLVSTQQVWEACIPKDPDQLAMLVQESTHFRLNKLTEKAEKYIKLHTTGERRTYVLLASYNKQVNTFMSAINDQ
uniref:BTB_2 domain-containing protein n=1 Tax=Rhabditophanes sp. KR3021 TaxID=114890 RepID=A0AC35U124_9BILA